MNLQKKSLGVFSLVMINLAAILSLRNMPVMSSYGLAMIPFYLLAALVFFLPLAFISAELASLIPEEGGIYAWIRRAIGDKTAFLCVWLDLVVTLPALTMTLVFISSSLGYIWSPELAKNPSFVCCIVIPLTWLATFFSLKGMRVSTWITTASLIGGIVIPAFIIIVLALFWLLSSHPIELTFSTEHIWHKFNSFSNLSFLTGLIFGFAGIEMSAFHIRDVENPRKSYPKAILISILVILALSIMGSLAIALVVPKSELRLESGVIQSISFMLEGLHLGWLSPFIGFLIAFGGAAYTLAWIAGPPRGLLATRTTGDLPLFLQKTNKNGMPSTILILQAAIISMATLIFVWMPSLSLGFWVLNVVSAVLVLVMYFFIFLSGLILRYKMPDTPREFRIPFGNFGMWVLALLGLSSVVFCLGIGFVLPDELAGTLSQQSFAWIVLALVVLLVIPPVLFHAFKKPSWKTQDFL